jgi:hypothetical protein
MAYDHRPMYVQCRLNHGLYVGDVAPTTFLGPVNITKLELNSITQEQERLISNMEGSWGEALASVSKPTDPGTMVMEFNSMPTELLSLVIGADVTALTQTADTITDEVITTVLHTWVPLASKFLDSSVPLVLETDGTPDIAIATTKYEVDYNAGLIRALHADAVGVAKLATYKKLLITAGESYAAGKAKSAYIMLYGTAIEKVTGNAGLLTVYKASVSPSSAYDWVKGGFATGSLTGDLITPPGYSSPYLFEYNP